MTTLDRLRELHREARAFAVGLEHEVYHRRSSAIRVLRDGERDTLEITRGVEEGLAVRARPLQGGSISFAACSGGDLPAVRWAIERCKRYQLPDPCSDSEMWFPADGHVEQDLDEGPPPSDDEPAEWLGAALASVTEPDPQARVMDAWVEVATTVETWVADGGTCASRLRRRGWACLRLRPTGHGGVSEPLMVAARRFSDLDPGGWAGLLADRRVIERDAAAPSGRSTILFSPECSAILVRALVSTLARFGDSEGNPVGPAWRVLDDPLHPRALFGGSFDDACFPTRRVVLADGRTWTGSLAGRGHLRRPSFRDPPHALPSNLALTQGNDAAPTDALVATSLDLHPLAPDCWVLGISGFLLADGAPIAAVPRAFVSIGPDALVERCSRSVGPVRHSRHGVSTPALVFEDLAVEC